MDIFVICARLSLPYSQVCFMKPCGHLFVNGCLSAKLKLDFVTFPEGVLCQRWYLIVLIPDLCLLFFILYFFIYFFRSFFLSLVILT